MMFQKRIERAFKWQQDRQEKAGIKGRQDLPPEAGLNVEKEDVKALCLSGLLVFLPIAILVLLLITIPILLLF